MKHLTSYHSSSSSSPSSSSSTLSVTTTARCFSAIFRRILCSSGLPTHPSDQIRELDYSMLSGKDQELKVKYENTKEATTSTSASAIAATTTTTISTPRIVAKLMGLESNLEIIPFKATQSSSLSRSQSMNSVDYLGQLKKPTKGMHRRVKSSSSSFCEVPTFHLHENDNFLVLSFESGCENKEFKSKGKKKGSGSAELKRNKREKLHEEMNGCADEKVNYLRKRVSDLPFINVGNDGELQSIGNSFSMNMRSSDENECFASEVVKASHPLKLKEVANGEKVKRRKKGKTCHTEKKVENECISEDSSPVSVFDFEREALETEVDSPGVDLSWRRQLSPELENELLFVLYSDSNLIVEERNAKANEKNKKERSKKKEKQIQDCADIWGEICRLVENELVGSNQMGPTGMRKQGVYDSISADFGSEIFDHLLNELIDQLVFSD